MNTILFFLIASFTMASHPDTFVSLTELCPGIKVHANYATTENFTGEVVPGYKAKKAFMALGGPAEALCRAHKKAEETGYGMSVFDSYRPTKAVAFFQEWAQRPETNPEIRNTFYPRYTRLDLFELGYIAKQSTHSRGAAIDLTLFDLKTGKNLDMGSSFDYFDDISHTDSGLASENQRQNRMILKNLMEAQGFKNFSQEWWHYSYRPEPFPNQSFNFDVE